MAGLKGVIDGINPIKDTENVKFNFSHHFSDDMDFSDTMWLTLQNASYFILGGLKSTVRGGLIGGLVGIILYTMNGENIGERFEEGAKIGAFIDISQHYLRLLSKYINERAKARETFYD